jgi:hypothetical protein
MYNFRYHKKAWERVLAREGGSWLHWNSSAVQELELDEGSGGGFAELLKADSFACTEAVVQQLLELKPTLAVEFLEFAGDL